MDLSPSLALLLVNQASQLPDPFAIFLHNLVLRYLLCQIESLVEMAELVSVGSEVELEGLLDSGDGARDGDEVDGGVGGEEPVQGSLEL